MMKILLPTDFSDNAWNAIFTAIKLYANIPCYFYVLHAYEPNELNLLGKNSQQRLGVIYDSLSQYAVQELNKIVTYLNKNHRNSNHSFETISKSDTLNEALTAIVRTKDIDLIAMGTQGATGAKEVFIGSSTVKVLKHIKNCPVLVIPTGYNFQRLKALVFPTNFDSAYEKFELSPMMELVALWNAEIQVVHIAVEFVLSDIQKENRKILEERLASLKYSYHNAPFEKNLSNSIEKFATENDIDVMAMIRNHHTFWEKIIGEPVVKKTALHSPIPVLMLPER